MVIKPGGDFMKKNKKGYSALEATVVTGIILALGFGVMNNYRTTANDLGDKSTNVMSNITNSDIFKDAPVKP